MPRVRALAFIILLKAGTDPPTYSAMAVLASLPDETAMPVSSCSTVTCSFSLRPMREPPVRAALRLTNVVLSMLARPELIWSMARNMDMTLVNEAGGMGWSAFCSKSTASRSRSYKMAEQTPSELSAGTAGAEKTTPVCAKRAAQSRMASAISERSGGQKRRVLVMHSPYALAERQASSALRCAAVTVNRRSRAYGLRKANGKSLEIY